MTGLIQTILTKPKRKILKQVQTQKHKIIYALILLFTGLSLCAFSIDEEIALLYINEAYAKVQNNDAETAISLLHKAEQYSDQYSDTYYMRYLLNEDIFMYPLRGIDTLKHALEINQFVVVSPDTVLLELAYLYYRTQQYHLSLNRLDSLPFPLTVREEFLYLYGLNLLQLGETHRAVQILRDAYKLFPNSVKILVQLVQIDGIRRDIVLHEILENPQSYPLSVYEALIPHLYDKAYKARLLNHYFLLGGDSLEMHLINSEFRGLIRRDIDYIFSHRDLRTRRLLNLAIETIKETAHWTYFEYLLHQFSGIIQQDLNNDGYFEVFEEYKNGKLVRLSRDVRQNKIFEWVLDLEDAPMLVQQRGDEAYNFYYQSFPYLSKLSIVDETERRDYIFQARSVILPPLKNIHNLSILSTPEFNLTLRDFDVSMLKQHISTYLITDEQGDRQKRIRQITENIALEDVFKGDRLYSSAILDSGKYTVKIRSLIDNDFLEIVEYYDGDTLVSMLIDANNSGVYEYAEILDGDHYVHFWDLNEDGQWDLREWQEGLYTFRGFVGEDGQWAYHIKIRDNKLISLFRHEKEYSVKPSAVDNVYWLGAVGQVDENYFLDKNGFVILNDLIYYVFRFGNSLYIEER